MTGAGTVTLANAGLSPIQILRNYYPRDIEIAESNIFTGITESFPGVSLRQGDRGLDVQVMQKFLNRIRRNYPAIPAIASENGIFGADTTNAVRIFQRTFGLPENGVIDRATWFKISYIYVAVARLAELDGEGSTLGIGTIPPNATLRQGSTGQNVITLQYILSYIAEFYPVVAPPAIDGVFGSGTTRSVIDFQRMMGLSQDGVVGSGTWNALYDTYWGIRNNVRPPVVNNYIDHIVQPGESLYLLAQRYGTTVDIIRRLNGLTSDEIVVGQRLKIPAPTEVTPPPEEYFNYTVVAGDTLWLLAQRFGTTVDAIKALNNLTSDVLNIGQVLKIPSTIIVQPPPPPPPPQYFNHTVVSGDTLWNLSQRFGTTVDAIKTLNGLTSDALSIGQVLKIPGAFFQYTVVSGDTLYLLAQKFGTTVAIIKSINNLTSDYLSIGQVLLIPGA